MTSLIGVDWAVGSLRAWRLDAHGTVIDRRESVDGLRRAARRGHEKTLLRHVGGWLEPDTTVVISSSLADRRGWIETPFLAAPSGLEALLGAAVRRPLRGASLLALPGVAIRAVGASDVMRREALLALGMADERTRHGGDDAAQRLLVVPGTRTRWIRVVDTRIVAFRTAIGGELLARLLGGPFGKALPADGANEGPAFLDGVEQGYRSRHIVTDLFSARAAALLDERDPDLVRARLAGLVLGNEVREAEITLEATGEALTLIGEDSACEPYAHALRHLGTTVGQVGTEAAAVAAFRAVRSALAVESPMTVPADRPSTDRTGAARPVPAVDDPARTCRDWSDAFARLPLLGFLPVGDPRRTVAAATLLIEAGFRILFVSMHDVHAPTTVRHLSEAFGSRVCIGVRDVPTPESVTAAVAAGARVVVASDIDETLARDCARHDIPWIPGIATLTEATHAIALGARALLLRPAGPIEPRVVQAMRRALPTDVPLVAAGAASVRTLPPYVAAGVGGAVADEALTSVGASRVDAIAAARAFAAAWCRLERGRRRLDAHRHAPAPPDTPQSAPSDVPPTPAKD